MNCLKCLGQIEITPSDVEPFLRVANDLKIW